MNELYENSRYTAPYEWLINKNIREWDLRKANISILRSLNLISEKEYQKFLVMPRESREYVLGCLRRDNKEIEEGYKYGLLNARKEFFERNELDDYNILYIDNDSITTVHEWRDSPNIDGHLNSFLEFRLRNQYTSFYRLFFIDFLYYNMDNKEIFRLKGVNEEKLRRLHKDGFLDLLLTLAYCAQYDGIVDTIDILKNIYKEYCKKNLDINYYREFNNDSRFRLYQTDNYIYYVDFIEDYQKNDVDITYNLNILILLYKIFMNEYFKSK